MYLSMTSLQSVLRRRALFAGITFQRKQFDIKIKQAKLKNVVDRKE